ncbi:MAG: polysaccharide deacetylase family protein [Coriobacteriia bacterium]|nr:polysaccharide deacetylase family protein [Coriobacteriia bacterium]
MNPLPLKTALGDRWRAARARFRGTAMVLAYHRIAELPCDPQRICLTPERFAEQIAIVAKEHETMTCGELLGIMRDGGRLPHRAMVVTIDDGYVDNLTHALPVLRQYGVPATAFLSSGFIGAPREFWWDELERLVLTSGELPQRIDIRVDETAFSHSLRAERPWTDADATRWADWDITRPAPTPRHELFLALCTFVRPLTGAGREAALAQLRAELGASEAVREHNRTLSAEEVRELDRSGVFEIGAHTVTHQVLSARTEAEQREEIFADKAALEGVLGHSVRSFCYPHGARDRFDETSVRLAREAGFDGACTTDYGVVVPWLNRYAVPRCHTENIGGDEFRALTTRWFDLGR